jgi:hypothetical protein
LEKGQHRVHASGKGLWRAHSGGIESAQGIQHKRQTWLGLSHLFGEQAPVVGMIARFQNLDDAEQTDKRQELKLRVRKG